MRTQGLRTTWPTHIGNLMGKINKLIIVNIVFYLANDNIKIILIQKKVARIPLRALQHTQAVAADVRILFWGTGRKGWALVLARLVTKTMTQL